MVWCAATQVLVHSLESEDGRGEVEKSRVKILTRLVQQLQSTKHHSVSSWLLRFTFARPVIGLQGSSQAGKQRPRDLHLSILMFEAVTAQREGDSGCCSMLLISRQSRVAVPQEVWQGQLFPTHRPVGVR